MEIWLVDVGRSGAALEACEASKPRLSDQDVVRFNAVRDAGSRQQRRAVAIALRLLIARMAGDGRFDRVAFTHASAGKPALPLAHYASPSHGAIVFSLSHAQDRGLIAVARTGPVGVDIEGARQLHMSPARRLAMVRAAGRIATEAAVAEAGFGAAVAAADADADADVLCAWVRLEAYAKALGCGIGQVLTDAGVLAPSVGARRAAALEATACGPPPEGLTTRVLALPDAGATPGSWFAAVAAPEATLSAMTPVRVLPETAAGLAALVAGSA